MVHLQTHTHSLSSYIMCQPLLYGEYISFYCELWGALVLVLLISGAKQKLGTTPKCCRKSLQFHNLISAMSKITGTWRFSDVTFVRWIVVPKILSLTQTLTLTYVGTHAGEC